MKGLKIFSFGSHHKPHNIILYEESTLPASEQAVAVAGV